MTNPTSSGTSTASGTAAPGAGFLLATGVALLALLVAAVALFLPSDGDDDGSGGGPVAATGETATFAVELGDLFAKPATLEVAAGTAVVLDVSNNGAIAHDLKLAGTTGTAMLEPGATETVDLGPIGSTAQLWCTVPGHKDAGMVVDLVVTGSAPAADDGHDGGTAAASGIDFAAEPGEGWEPYDPRLAPAPGGTEHEVTLRATEEVLEIAPGVEQEMWTFGGQVPGPVLRGKVGDIFTVTLVNDGKLGHSIDFHASKVAWNDEMRTIQPGESLVYQFEAKHAGVFMYHCGTAPALHHIGNGMFGAVVIDPPDLPAVDHEFLFVQSELYTSADGGPAPLSKMAADQWDAVVFNGYVNQYLHAPIRVEVGQRVRAWVIDDGPSENSSFHIVGTIFDTVYKEGEYLLRPGPGQGGSQALSLQPAQGGFVEFTFDEAGLYPMVTHKFSNVGKGALGLFQAGEVASAGGASH